MALEQYLIWGPAFAGTPPLAISMRIFTYKMASTAEFRFKRGGAGQTPPPRVISRRP